MGGQARLSPRPKRRLRAEVCRDVGSDSLGHRPWRARDDVDEDSRRHDARSDWAVRVLADLSREVERGGADAAYPHGDVEGLTRVVVEFPEVVDLVARDELGDLRSGGIEQAGHDAGPAWATHPEQDMPHLVDGSQDAQVVHVARRVEVFHPQLIPAVVDASGGGHDRHPSVTVEPPGGVRARERLRVVSVSPLIHPLACAAGTARSTLSSMMTDPSGGVVRGVRAANLSTVILALAVAGHVLGGGAWPSWGALLAVIVLAGALSAVLTNRRLTPVRLLAALSVGQLSVHEILSLTTGHGSVGHDHAAMAAGASEGMPSGWAVTWLGTDLRMLAGHAAATVVAAAVIAYGERVLWLAWEAVRPRALTIGTPVVRPVARTWCAAVVLPPRSLALALTADPRGPPVMSAA